MVAAVPFVVHLMILLATRSGDSPRQRTTPPSTSGKNPKARKGRQRYAPSSREHQNDNDNVNHRTNNQSNRNKSRPRRTNQVRNYPQRHQHEQQPEALPDPPPLTGPHGPFPTYFTCRHTYEDVLVEEITRASKNIVATSPCPGLVHVEGLQQRLESTDLDPVYALQMLPHCRIVKSENSVKKLAQAIARADGFAELLAPAPRGSLLAIHALVPGMCKGQKDPILQRRSHLVAQAVADQWKRQFAAARKPLQKNNDVDGDYDDDDTGSSEKNSHDNKNNQGLLLQILLLSPDIAAASLHPCRSVETSLSTAHAGWQWPNPRYPVGMAQVDVKTQKMPSSAYRKLLEAFACFGMQPSCQDTIVDLGASPGGWTSALLLYCDQSTTDTARSSNAGSGSRGKSGIHVFAVDRSPLDPKLLKDPRVTFVQGDAFTFEPDDQQPVDWMVSDIISYPERIVERLQHWCVKQLASNMIVTMKFQGSTPSWTHLDEALQVAQAHGYAARAKHFFNNKNEVTLMISRHKRGNGSSQPSSPTRGAVAMIPSFYKRVLPAEI